MKTELQSRGVEIEPSGPKKHIPQVEKLTQTKRNAFVLHLVTTSKPPIQTKQTLSKTLKLTGVSWLYRLATLVEQYECGG